DQEAADDDGSGSGQGGEPGPDEGGQAPEADSGDPTDDQEPPEESGSDGADRSTGRENPADEAADPEAQREADEALREQMERALDRAAEEDAATEAVDAAAIEENERREAADAWLRRIPDEPGGLLRARFSLQPERRRRQGADRADARILATQPDHRRAAAAVRAAGARAVSRRCRHPRLARPRPHPAG